MRTIELFCGTKSFSRVMHKAGHETYTVDNDFRAYRKSKNINWG